MRILPFRVCDPYDAILYIPYPTRVLTYYQNIQMCITSGVASMIEYYPRKAINAFREFKLSTRFSYFNILCDLDIKMDQNYGKCKCNCLKYIIYASIYEFVIKSMIFKKCEYYKLTTSLFIRKVFAFTIHSITTLTSFNASAIRTLELV